MTSYATVPVPYSESLMLILKLETSLINLILKCNPTA